MSDLVEFLKARLDEDEELAREAVDGLYPSEGPDDYVHHLVSAESNCTDEQYRHADRWNPFRVLAEVAAKRQVIIAYEASSAPFLAAQRSGLWMAVKALATAYSDHPDFAPAWQRAQ